MWLLKLGNSSSLELLSYPNYRGEKWLLDCPGNLLFLFLGLVLSWHGDREHHRLLVSQAELWEEWLHHPTFLEVLNSNLPVMTQKILISCSFPVPGTDLVLCVSGSCNITDERAVAQLIAVYASRRKKVIFIDLRTSESDSIQLNIMAQRLGYNKSLDGRFIWTESEVVEFACQVLKTD